MQKYENVYQLYYLIFMTFSKDFVIWMSKVINCKYCSKLVPNARVCKKEKKYLKNMRILCAILLEMIMGIYKNTSLLFSSQAKKCVEKKKDFCFLFNFEMISSLFFLKESF